MATKKGQLTQLNNNNELDLLYPETSSDQVVESNEKQFISANEKTKLSGIESGAEVNVIEGVEVNDTLLVPDANKIIHITMPTDVGADLDYNSNTGVLSLIDKDGNVLGSVDLPLELLISGGYYDDVLRELVLVLSNFVLSNPQPTSTTFVTNKYYTYNSATDTYTLAVTYSASDTYYEHSEIRIPVGDLIDIYTGDGTNIEVDSNNVIKLTQAFLTRISSIETDITNIVNGTTKVGSAESADEAGKLASPITLALSGDATGSASVDGSQDVTIQVALANSGVTAGTYSAVQVNAKGIVTQGGQIFEVGSVGQTTPSSSLAVGGLFFKDTSSNNE